MPIQRKGERHLCEHYRGIVLLIQQKLVETPKDILRQHQRKSTLDTRHTVKQIMENTHERKWREKYSSLTFNKHLTP